MLNKPGKLNVFRYNFYAMCVFSFLATKLHHLSISSHLSCEKRRPGHFQQGLKGPNFCESLRAQKGCHTIPPRRILTQKGATAANKTFKPTFVGGEPPRKRIRFQGNVSKIEFLEAFSLDDC